MKKFIESLKKRFPGATKLTSVLWAKVQPVLAKIWTGFTSATLWKKLFITAGLVVAVVVFIWAVNHILGSVMTGLLYVFLVVTGIIAVAGTLNAPKEKKKVWLAVVAAIISLAILTKLIPWTFHEASQIPSMVWIIATCTLGLGVSLYLLRNILRGHEVGEWVKPIATALQYALPLALVLYVIGLLCGLSVTETFRITWPFFIAVPIGSLLASVRGAKTATVAIWLTVATVILSPIVIRQVTLRRYLKDHPQETIPLTAKRWIICWPDVDKATGELNDRTLQYEMRIVYFSEYRIEMVMTRRGLNGQAFLTFFMWDRSYSPTWGTWKEDNPPLHGKWNMRATNRSRFDGTFTDDENHLLHFWLVAAN